MLNDDPRIDDYAEEKEAKLQAELGFIGCLIGNDPLCDEYLSKAIDGMFSTLPGELFFNAIRSLRENRSPVTGTTVSSALEPDYSKLGGKMAVENLLVDCKLYGDMPSHTPFFFDKIKGDWVKRALVSLGKKAAKPDFEWTDSLEQMGRIMTLTLSSSNAIQAEIGECYDATRKPGIASAFDFVNALDSKGYPCGQTVLVKAQTGHGKSVFMAQEMLEMAQNGIPCIYFTLADLNRHDIHARLRRMLTGHSFEDPYEPKEWNQMVKEMNRLPITIVDATRSQHGKTIEAIEASVRMFRKKHRGHGCVFIDYAQKIKSIGIKGKPHEVATAISERVQELASEIDWPILIGSQITVSDAGDVSMGSRTWDQDAGLWVQVKQMFAAEDKKKLPEDVRGVKGITIMEMGKSRFGVKARRFAQLLTTHVKFIERPDLDKE